MVRRAESLQKTADAKSPRAWMNARLMASLGVAEGDLVRVRQGDGQSGGSVELRAGRDDNLPDRCVRVAAAHASTAALGPMFGALAVEKVPVQKAA